MLHIDSIDDDTSIDWAYSSSIVYKSSRPPSLILQVNAQQVAYYLLPDMTRFL